MKEDFDDRIQSAFALLQDVENRLFNAARTGRLSRVTAEEMKSKLIWLSESLEAMTS